MIIKCSLCGKKYNLDYNGANCPECGQRNYDKDGPRNEVADTTSQSALGGDLEKQVAKNFSTAQYHESVHDKAHSDLHNKYDGGGHHTGSPKNFSPHYTVNEDNTSHVKKPPINRLRFVSGGNAKVKPRSCSYYFVMIFLIQVVIVLFTVMGVIKTGLRDQLEDDVITGIGVKEHELYEDTTYYYFDVLDTAVVIEPLTEGDAEEYMTWNIPDSYHVCTYMYQYVTYEDYYSYYENGDLLEIYAVTKDGKFIAPLTSYEVEEMVVEDPYDMLDYIVSDLGYEYGYLCFLIDENDIDHIIIDEYSGERDDREFELRHELK